MQALFCVSFLGLLKNHILSPLLYFTLPPILFILASILCRRSESLCLLESARGQLWNQWSSALHGQNIIKQMLGKRKLLQNEYDKKPKSSLQNNSIDVSKSQLSWYHQSNFENFEILFVVTNNYNCIPLFLQVGNSISKWFTVHYTFLSMGCLPG